jgi:hypothetical protein
MDDSLRQILDIKAFEGSVFREGMKCHAATIASIELCRFYKWRFDFVAFDN